MSLHPLMIYDIADVGEESHRGRQGLFVVRLRGKVIKERA